MLFTVFAYTFLHESGHAIVGILCGGKITDFSVNFLILSAFVRMDTSLTPAQAILNNLAGGGLPLLAWFVFVIAAPRRANFVIETLKLSTSLVFLSTLLAWIFLPILDIFGQAPASDDIIKFIRNSGLLPLWVTFFSLILFSSGIFLAVNRFDGLKTFIETFRDSDMDVSSPKIRASLFSLLAISILLGLTVFALNGFRFSTSTVASFVLPPDSRLIKTISLAESAHDKTNLCDFTLTESAPIGIYLIVENINTSFVDVRLTGPASYDQVIVHGEGYSAAFDYPRLETTLQPGHYMCLLTSQPSSGTISLYIKGLP